MHEWSVFSTMQEAAAAAAEFIAAHILESLAQRDICHVILSGGSTPPPCLTLLTQKAIPWEQVHWYPGDERCFPRGHAERNDVMLEKFLWSKINHANIHRIPTELGAEAAADAYRDEVHSINIFDIAFLGLGEDGHTASLFPGNAALQDTRSIVPVYDSPKPPSERVSFSLNTLKKSRHRLILAGGAGKAEVVQRIRQGENLPVNSIGDIHWFIDSLAAGES